MEGFYFILSDKVVLMVPILFFIMSLSYIPLEILMPLRMRMLDMGPSGYGTFFACLLSGSILSSLFLSKYGNRFSLKMGTLLGLVCLSFPLIGIAFYNSFLGICCFGFIFGISSSFVSVNLVSYVQVNINEHYRGRVFGIFGTIENIGMPVALSGFGVLISYVPFQWIFFINALIILGIAFLWFLTNSPFSLRFAIGNNK